MSCWRKWFSFCNVTSYCCISSLKKSWKVNLDKLEREVIAEDIFNKQLFVPLLKKSVNHQEPFYGEKNWKIDSEYIVYTPSTAQNFCLSCPVPFLLKQEKGVTKLKFQCVVKKEQRSAKVPERRKRREEEKRLPEKERLYLTQNLRWKVKIFRNLYQCLKLCLCIKKNNENTLMRMIKILELLQL